MNLVDRTKSILLSPQQEWQAIDEEETSIGGLVTGYIVPLAAIGPVASLIGMEIFGISVPSVGTFRVPIGAALRQGITQYVMALVGVFVLALIIDKLAPYFRVEENRYQALKIAAYSSTPVWIVRIVRRRRNPVLRRRSPLLREPTSWCRATCQTARNRFPLMCWVC